jgi:hypothetical protein
MINISPITRITLGLVLIMMSIFLMSDMLGFIPNRDAAVKKGRSDLAENLAVQFSIDAQPKKEKPARLNPVCAPWYTETMMSCRRH